MRIFLNSLYELLGDSDIAGDTMLVRLRNDQITQLHLNSYVEKDKSTHRHGFEVFVMILSVSNQLCDLNLSQYILNNVSSSNFPRRTCTSSTLTKLNVFVYSFDDCLYLVDGQFQCLSILIIEITGSIDSMSNRENKVSRDLSEKSVADFVFFRKDFFN